MLMFNKNREEFSNCPYPHVAGWPLKRKIVFTDYIIKMLAYKSKKGAANVCGL